jgi:alkylation response protein AidB-like acyl-CoA dehydrogenase
MLTEEHLMIRDAVREFAMAELSADAAAVDREARFPHAAWPKLAGLDLLGLAVPAAAGGAGAGDTAFVLSVLEVGRVCGSTAAALAVHATLGALPIAVAGDDAQRRRWLPPLLAGERFATLVATDVALAAPSMVATPGDAGFTLDGVCDAVPGAGAAATLVVPARYPDSIDFGLFVLDAAAPGVTQTPAPAGLGLRGLGHGRVELRGVAAPPGARLGDADAARLVLANVQEGVWIGMAAAAAGIAQGAFERALRYARERPQFDRPIIEHESVQWLLA